jgi:hypothetical protein
MLGYDVTQWIAVPFRFGQKFRLLQPKNSHHFTMKERICFSASYSSCSPAHMCQQPAVTIRAISGAPRVILEHLLTALQNICPLWRSNGELDYQTQQLIATVVIRHELHLVVTLQCRLPLNPHIWPPHEERRKYVLTNGTVVVVCLWRPSIPDERGGACIPKHNTTNYDHDACAEHTQQHKNALIRCFCEVQRYAPGARLVAASVRNGCRACRAGLGSWSCCRGPIQFRRLGSPCSSR